MVDAVTPTAGTTSQIGSTGGQAVQAAPGGIKGGFITNPLTGAEQGLAGDAEPLYVDPVGACGTLQANGTIFRLEPGQSWTLISGQTTVTNVNAASAGHKFSVVTW